MSVTRPARPVRIVASVDADHERMRRAVDLRFGLLEREIANPGHGLRVLAGKAKEAGREIRVGAAR